MLRRVTYLVACAYMANGFVVSNVLPRTSVGHSQIMDAHDGNVLQQLQANGTYVYYLYAAGYGKC